MSSRELDRDAGAAEVDEGDQGSAEWKPKLRWLMRRMRLLRPSRRPLLSPSWMAARIPSRWRRMVRASFMNGSNRDREAQVSQLSRCAGARAGILELVEQPQLLFEQERAVERPVGLLDFAELGELVHGLLGGGLEQRPAGALDPLPGLRVGAVVGVPLLAADLVHGALAEVGSARGAVAAFRLLRFRGPPTESGRGQARPGPSHTTRHAGPHRAVRSAFPEVAVGSEESFQAGGLVPVGVRQGALEWPGPSHAPVALLRRRP